MAKLSLINRNEKRKKLVARFAKKRAALVGIIDNQKASEETRYAARQKLQALPRNANPTRVRNRCEVTGRPRAYYRKFRLCRIQLRDLANKGLIPGVTKSSW